jgi:hypothetical protein
VCADAGAVGRGILKIERKLPELTAERTAIEAALSDGSTSATLIDRFAQLSREVDPPEARWMDGANIIEAAEFDVAGGR